MKIVPDTVLALFVLCLASTAAVPPVLAAGQADQPGIPQFGLGVGLGRLDGNTLYHISSYDWAGNGVESELKFPLQTTFLAVEGSITSRDRQGRDVFAVSLQWATNIDNGSGQVQDSDWLSNTVDIGLVGSAHPGLDIYSLSEPSLDATMLDLRASLNFWPVDRAAVGTLVGYLYQHFSYDVSNLNQVGFGPYAPGYTGSVPGPVATYEVTYMLPYFGCHAEGRPGDTLRMAVDLGYSPAAAARDQDNHLLRYKQSEASTSGRAYIVAADARWTFLDTNELRLRWQYLKITTTGSQTQTWYYAPNPDGVPAGYSIGGIPDRVTSEQTTLSLLLSHRF